MKKITVIVLIIFSSFLLKFCFPVSEDYNPSICAAFSVPGMMGGDLREETTSVVETDTHGRVLFKYETKNSIIHETTEVLVVMQKSDKNYVYFYEDENYLFDTSSSEEIEAFKARNDWNLELQPEKMSRRPIPAFTFDLVMIVDSILDSEKAENAIMTNIPSPVDEVYCLYVEDCDYSKNELYYFEGMAGNETTVDYEAFKEFKHQSGWKYGH